METVEEAFISPEVSGQVVAINVREGEKVNKGHVLAKLSTAVLEKSIQEVKSQLNLAEIVYEKQTSLWEKNIGSEIQYPGSQKNYEGLQNKLETLRAQYNLAVIESPIDGMIEDIFLKQGENWLVRECSLCKLLTLISCTLLCNCQKRICPSSRRVMR